MITLDKRIPQSFVGIDNEVDCVFVASFINWVALVGIHVNQTIYASRL